MPGRVLPQTAQRWRRGGRGPPARQPPKRVRVLPPAPRPLPGPRALLPRRRRERAPPRLGPGGARRPGAPQPPPPRPFGSEGPRKGRWGQEAASNLTRVRPGETFTSSTRGFKRARPLRAREPRNPFHTRNRDRRRLVSNQRLKRRTGTSSVPERRRRRTRRLSPSAGGSPPPLLDSPTPHGACPSRSRTNKQTPTERRTAQTISSLSALFLPLLSPPAPHRPASGPRNLGAPASGLGPRTGRRREVARAA